MGERRGKYALKRRFWSNHNGVCLIDRLQQKYVYALGHRARIPVEPHGGGDRGQARLDVRQPDDMQWTVCIYLVPHRHEPDCTTDSLVHHATQPGNQDTQSQSAYHGHMGI